jgi:hypothetical protein
MKICREEIGKFAGIFLVLMVLIYGGVVRGAEIQKETPATQVQEEEVPEKKPPEKKPLEKPPSLLPAYLSSMMLYAPYYTTFEPGPSIGVQAPYTYSGAEDTLIRGWNYHKLGPVRFSPYLSYDGLYRTNVFQSYTDKKSDYVNAIAPGIRFELPIAGRHKLSMGYLGNYFIYSRYNDLSHCDHNFNGDAAINFPKLSIGVGTAYRHAVEEPSSELLSRERPYNRITPYFKAAYTMADRWRVETNYQFDTLLFPKKVDSIDDRQYHNIGATLFYKFWPKTSALVQYLVSIRGHSNLSSENNTVHTPMVGLTWEPTAKLSGTVKFGYTTSTLNSVFPGSTDFPGSWALSIQTLYRFSRYTQLSLIAQRSIQEDVDYLNASYINSGVFVTLSHFWHYFRVTSYANFSYYNNRYLVDNFDPFTGELKKQNDNIYSFGCGLSRPVTRWLKVRIDYLYYDKGSNISYIPFNEHKLLFGIQTSF